jgi:hypothetical protein
MTTNKTTVIAASEANLAARKDAGDKILRPSTDDIAATVAKAVEFLAAQPVPMNTKDAFAGEFVEIPATKLIADVDLDDVQMLVALRDNEFGLEKELGSIGWDTICRAGRLNRPKADLSKFVFRHKIGWKVDLEEAIALMLAHGEDLESTDDDDDRYYERFYAAVPVVRNYLLNLTTKWTARDVKLARVYVELLTESNEDSFIALEDCVESLTELNEALLRGLEAAGA